MLEIVCLKDSVVTQLLNMSAVGEKLISVTPQDMGWRYWSPNPSSSAVHFFEEGNSYWITPLPNDASVHAHLPLSTSSHAKGLCGGTEGIRAGELCDAFAGWSVTQQLTELTDSCGRLRLGIASSKDFKIQITRLCASVKSSANSDHYPEDPQWYVSKLIFAKNQPTESTGLIESFKRTN